MITENRIPPEKIQLAEEVAAQVAEFTASGGVIQQVEPGVQNHRVLPASSREARQATWIEQ